ncbi:MAG: hypothetical protein K0S09_1126 [Sphingobacteriaceae bacterium]|jgi:hypothetical protein|nr:hypothetical protein [Sphingobacteriaceae bacterium]
MKAILILIFSSIVAFNAAAQNVDSVGRKPMANAALNKLLKTTGDQSSLDEHLVRSRFLNSTSYYTTAQVRRILKLYAKDSDKIIVARAMYPRVIDNEKYEQLANVFNSDTYSREFAYWCQDPNKKIIDITQDHWLE